MTLQVRGSREDLIADNTNGAWVFALRASGGRLGDISLGRLLVRAFGVDEGRWIDTIVLRRWCAPHGCRVQSCDNSLWVVAEMRFVDVLEVSFDM